MTNHFRILVIEDNPLDTRVVLRMLGEANVVSLAAVAVSNLAQAIGRLQEGEVDAVLLDLGLGETTGLATYAQLQAAFPELPIVILTGTDNQRLAVEAVQQGAQDYLVKWHVDSNSLARALWYAIERRGRRHVEASLRATHAELQTARRVQQALLPSAVPVLPGYDLAGAWHPAEAACGDYFDFIPMGERYLGIVLGDVCGHGLGPALVMAETRSCLRTLALTHADVGTILTIANRLLSDDMAEERFVTLFFARLDLATRTICYAGAGHQAYLMDAAGAVRKLESTAMPLGLDRDAVVLATPELPLAAGDMFVAVTDGVEDAMSPEGESFGMHKVMAVARGSRHKSAQQIVDQIINESVVEFTRGGPQDDDFTAVVLKVG